LGRHAQELCPILPVGAALIYQAEESFVYQGRGLQGVAHALTPHLTAGDTAQFSVNQRHQPLEGIAAAKFHLG
jgi:hypothetical protein